MNIYCLMLVVLAVSFKLSADPATNAAPLIIGTGDAAKFYDQQMTVTGKVVQVTIHQSIIFINLDKAYPDCPFALVIFTKNSKPFGDIAGWYGKDVAATGKIKNYHDRPEMDLDSTNQLKILPAAAAQ